MSRSNNPAKVLRVALRRIQRGWTKGTLYRGPGQSRIHQETVQTPQVCMLGAIHGYQALDSRQPKPANSLAEKATLAFIQEHFPTPAGISPVAGNGWTSIPQFNDHPDTTQEMVEEAIKGGLIKIETGWTPEETEVMERAKRKIITQNISEMF